MRPLLALLLLLTAWSARAQYDIDQFFFRGQRSLMEGQYTQAINNFNIIIRLDGSLYEAYFFRGIAKYNLGDFAGAESDFDLPWTSTPYIPLRTTTGPSPAAAWATTTRR